MQPKPSEYRHPKHDEIAAMLREGAADKAVCLATGADKRAVSRVRRILGLAPWTNAKTLAEKLAGQRTEPDENGHQFWTGRTGHSGTPVIRLRDNVYRPVAAVAFRQRTGREPDGQTYAECGVTHCVADAHVLDDQERRELRLQLRALQGFPPPWDVCPKGVHDWATYGRVEPGLTTYCKGCNTVRARTAQSRLKGRDV